MNEKEWSGLVGLGLKSVEMKRNEKKVIVQRQKERQKQCK